MFVWLTYHPAREVVVEPSGVVVAAGSAGADAHAHSVTHTPMRGVAVEMTVDAAPLMEVVEPSATIPAEGTTSFDTEGETINLAALRGVSAILSAEAWNYSAPIPAEPSAVVSVEARTSAATSSPGQVQVQARRAASITTTVDVSEFVVYAEPVASVVHTAFASPSAQGPASVHVSASTHRDLDLSVDAGLHVTSVEPSATISTSALTEIAGQTGEAIHRAASVMPTVAAEVHAWNLSIPIAVSVSAEVNVSVSTSYASSGPDAATVSARSVHSAALSVQARHWREHVSPSATITPDTSWSASQEGESIHREASTFAVIEGALEAGLWIARVEPSATIAASASAPSITQQRHVQRAASRQVSVDMSVQAQAFRVRREVDAVVPVSPRAAVDLTTPRLTPVENLVIQASVQAEAWETMIRGTYNDIGDRMYETFWGRNVRFQIEDFFGAVWMFDDLMIQLPPDQGAIIGNSVPQTLTPSADATTITNIRIWRIDGLSPEIEIPVNIPVQADRPVKVSMYGIRIDLI